MADNVISNPGVGGATFATDEIGSVHYPRTKIDWGTDGAATDVSTDSGGPLPIQLRSLGGALQGVAANPVVVDTEIAAALVIGDALASPTAGLVGAILLVWNGASWDRLRAASKRIDVNGTAVGSIATVWTPASGKKFRLMGGCISVSAAVSVLLEDNSAGAGNFICRTPKLLADTPYNFDLGNGYLSSAANNVLKATSSGAANLTGFFCGTEE